MKKIIIEVGSTVVKVDEYSNHKITKLEDKTIEFKKNYNQNKKLLETDITQLIELTKKYQNSESNIYVCGTSIFRNLTDDEKSNFLSKFEKETGTKFNIMSQEDESNLTIKGAVKNVKQKVCVFVGGGGSSEISIYDNAIIEQANSSFGVMDVMNKFPDLGNDTATTSLEKIKEYIKENINLPKGKADILILAGGAHEKFARESGITHEKNTLFSDDNAKLMMDIETRKKDTQKYYTETSLNEIKKKDSDPNWWYATRAMSAFVLVIAEEINAKYIIPTNISMVQGIVDK